MFRNDNLLIFHLPNAALNLVGRAFDSPVSSLRGLDSIPRVLRVKADPFLAHYLNMG